MVDIEGIEDDAEEIEIVYEVEEEAAQASAAEKVNEETPDAEKAAGAAEAELARLKEEHAKLRESYLRKLAEFDNFRKRTEREREELNRTAGEQVVRDLIPVLDNFERAVQHAADTDPEAFRLGVEMIAKQLTDILERQGLESMNPVGEVFQPEFHEALQRVEDSEHPPGTIVWVLAKGYSYGGRLLRPAMVGVATEPMHAAEVDTTDDSGEGEGEVES